MTDQSLWRDVDMPRFRRRALPAQVDVAIIGGGITGLTAGLLLKKAGKRVVVIEKFRIGSGESGRTSAHLTYLTDLALSGLSQRFGSDAARLVWQGGAVAIDLIESIAEQHAIDCGFQRVPGFICSSVRGTADESEFMQKEADLAQALGFAAQYLARGPLTGKPAVAYADQALFHPLAYLAGLAAAVHGDGSMVIDESEVSEVGDQPLRVVVDGSTIECDDVIVATNVPITGIASLVSATLFQTKIYPYSSYVIAARIPPGSVQPGLYSDTSTPYYFLRVHDANGYQVAIFGGEDHKTGTVDDTEAHYQMLETTLHQLLPAAEIERRWSGQVVETADGLPYIGYTAEHQFAGTGYSGNGLTFGTLAGIMAHDAILKQTNPLQGLLAPERKKAGALGTYLSENVDFPIHLIVDRLRHRWKSDVENIAPGDGKVLTIEGKRVACHCTEDGRVIKLSAVCTHLGCLVRWNQAESTWDCPCRGSRFTPEGNVIGGPAETPLERIEG